MRFVELRPLIEIHYDTNVFKGIPAWGYEFLLSRSAKDCLAMISESNHLNEWLLGKKEKIDRRRKRQEGGDGQKRKNGSGEIDTRKNKRGKGGRGR